MIDQAKEIGSPSGSSAPTVIVAVSHREMNLLGAMSRSLILGGSFSATTVSRPPFAPPPHWDTSRTSVVASAATYAVPSVGAHSLDGAASLIGVAQTR
ncbi:hypothetical protein [Sorangium sp. So ce887]|uniref:hypothetical protein n=1 Tax=Sorangium sp. So ce887 TaxID=3133324 RepID=UPI003F6368FE